MLSSCMAFAERLSRFYKEAEAFKVFLAQLKRINEINIVMRRLKPKNLTLTLGRTTKMYRMK